MFTGLISAVGEVAKVHRSEDGLELEVTAEYDDIEVGESIAVDGACLTVVRARNGMFAVHVVQTSIGRTCFGAVVPGARVNLERALRAGDRLGGHIVQGHVDGVGEVVGVGWAEDARLVDLTIPPAVHRSVIPLGSITVNGVSLTVNDMPGPGQIQISLIPITLEKTTLGALEVGDRVHIEGDVIGKYVDRLLGPARQTRGLDDRISEDPQPPASGLRGESIS
jgi:riboflavin synthase